MDQFSLVLISILRDGEKAPLWNWLGIGSEENLKNICSQSLIKAVQSLKKTYGDNRTEWEWGKVHQAHFAHPSQVKFLVDGGSYGVGGSRYTINVTHYFPSSGYEATFGSSYRFIATIENGKIVAKSVLPPGDLAAPLSPHFKDQAPLWMNGQLKNIPVYRDEFQKLSLELRMNPE
jgi:penicillin amidase